MSTAGQVISEDVGMTLDKADMTWLGRAKKATVTKDDTILLDGAGNKDMIEDRNEQLRQAISASTSDYDRSVLYAKARREIQETQEASPSQVGISLVREQYSDSMAEGQANANSWQSSFPFAPPHMLFRSNLQRKLVGVDSATLLVRTDYIKVEL